MELGPVDRITADAVGEPGDRTFYIQARAGSELVTVIVEKQQVQLLAASVLELLEDAPDDRTGAAGEAHDGDGLEEPLDPRWRAGRLSIGFDQERDLFLLEVEEFQPELEDLGRGRPGLMASPGDRTRVDPDLGLAGADAGALPARSGGGRARPADVPVLRQSDRRGGPCVSRDERALEAGLTDPAVPRVLAVGRARGPRPAPERVEPHLPRPRPSGRTRTCWASTSRGAERRRCGTSPRAPSAPERSRHTSSLGRWAGRCSRHRSP